MDLTLDTQILFFGSNIGAPEENRKYHDLSHELMKKMETDDDYSLVLDKKNKILTQYNRKIKPHWSGKWLQRMIDKEKILYVKTKSLKTTDKRIYIRLADESFTGGDDLKFVEAAKQSNCHIIVTYHTHFFQVYNILKKIPVYPRSCEECME